MLEAITLQNFKGYEHFHVIFPPGLTLITGSNYSGKTRLLHAILFAFWGVSAVPGGSKLVPTRGRKPSDTVVHARFYHQRHTYEIERKISTAKLFKDQELIASSTSAVNRELESVFNTPQKFFMRLKYAEQSETQALLTLGAAELHKVIEHVSGATIVNRVIERASKTATAAQNGLDVIGPTLDITALREQEQSLAERLTAMHTELEALKTQESTGQTTVAAMEQELQLAQGNNTQHQRLKQERQELETRLAEAQATHQAARDEISLYQEEADTCPALVKELEDANEYRRLWGLLEDGLRTRRDSLSRMQADLELAEATLVERKASLKALGTHDNSRAFQAKLDAHAKARATYDKARELEQACANAVCPTCDRPFEGKDVAALQAQWEKAKGEAAAALNCYEKAEAYAKQEEDKMTRIVHACQQRDSAITVVTSLRKAEATAVKELAEIEAEVKAAQPPPTDAYLKELNARGTKAMQAAGAVDSAKRRAATASARIKALTEQLDQAAELPVWTDVTPLQDKLQGLRQSTRDLTRRVLSKTSAYGVEYSQWTTLKAKLDTEAQRQEQVRDLQRQKETATSLAKYLRTNRDRFLQELWDQVMGYASNLASTCTGGVIERVERTPSGTFQYVEEGELAMIEGASGAQKSIMSIGVQLALDALLPDTFGALLLDEPTSQMDEDRSLMLTQMLAQTNQQIIMVSHRAMDSTVAQSHIHLE